MIQEIRKLSIAEMITREYGQNKKNQCSRAALK